LMSRESAGPALTIELGALAGSAAARVLVSPARRLAAAVA
jgi:hypothetical protein